MTRSALIALVLALALSACSGTRDAYRAAEGVNDTAKVVAEHYYALVKQANKAKEDGTLAGANLVRAQTAVRETQPIVMRMGAAAEAYEQVKSAATEAELSRALDAAIRAVSALIDTLKQANVTGALIEDLDDELVLVPA